MIAHGFTPHQDVCAIPGSRQMRTFFRNRPVPFVQKDCQAPIAKWFYAWVREGETIVLRIPSLSESEQYSTNEIGELVEIVVV